MSSEWQTSSLLDLYEVRSGLSKPSRDFGTGYPFLTFKDVFYNYFTPIQLGDLVQSTDKDREACSVRRGDVFLTRTSETMHELGMSCVALRDYPDAAFNGFCKRLRPKSNCEVVPEFAGYYFRSPTFRRAMLAMSSMSTRASLNNEMIARLEIYYPPKDIQEKIAGILKSLDDRITLLRETNATLEAIAQTLFKSWFVDFDPVHAKQEGRIPEGMDEVTAALFPDSFEESELGLVPKGWQTRPLYSMATYVNGAAYKKFEPNLERRGLPIIKIAELKAGVTAQTAFSDVAMPEKYHIKHGDILFSWSGNPDTSIDTFVWHHGDSLLNQHIFRVIPNQTEEKSFVLQTLKYLRPVFAELARNKQTTGLGHVTVADLKTLYVVRPDQPVLEIFNETINSIHAAIFENTNQTLTFSDIRDTLLPRLISGKLRLPEAEAELESVAS